MLTTSSTRSDQASPPPEGLARQLRRPLRILHVNHLLDLGGSEVMMLDLARQQQRQGHEVAICSMYGEGELDGKARAYGLPVFHLRSTPQLRAQVSALWRHLRAHPVDVVHSHWGVWLPTALAGTLTRTRVVHTHHANQMRRNFPGHRIATLFTDRIVVLTPTVDDYIAKWVNVPRRKVVSIPNGIELSRLQGAERVEIDGVPPDSPVVGMVARLSPPKDQLTFFRAAKLLEERFPEVHFVSVGDGINRPSIEAELTRLGTRNAHLLGNRLDVPGLLRRLEIKVLATRNEGLPISLLEAMASGCACIATDIPPIRFTLQEGRCGLLVPGADPAALADAIAKLLTDTPLREGLVANAREFVATLTSERMAAGYLDLYASLLPAVRT